MGHGCHATLPAMSRSLKNVLLWLLIAVLPLQGFAAVMLHGWTMPAPAEAMSTAMPAMDHAAMAMPMHDACAKVPAAGDASSHHGDKHGCSASAACCVAAAVPPGFPSLTLPLENAEVHRTWFITPAAGHIPDGLERPPKRFAI